MNRCQNLKLNSCVVCYVRFVLQNLHTEFSYSIVNLNFS